jgi:hypothetical protein
MNGATPTLLEKLLSSRLVQVRVCVISCVASAILAITPSGARADDTNDDTAVLPVVRCMLGTAFHFGATPPWQFMTDADVGVYVLLGENMRFFFDAELGYTFDHGGLDAFNLMAGVGAGWKDLINVAYQPRLLIGTLDRNLAAGMRSGLGVHFFTDLLNAEIGHQFLSSRSHLTQSLTFTLGVNPAAIIFMVLDYHH